MSAFRIWGLSAAASLVLIAAGVPTVQAAPETIHPLKLSVQGAEQGNDGVDDEIDKFRGRDSEIVQIAQDQDPDVRPPRNEILALRIDCANGDAQIVVWDKDTNTQLAVVSQQFNALANFVQSERNGLVDQMVLITEFDWASTGGVNVSIDGGTVHIAATAKFADVNGQQCPNTVKGSFTGTITITFLGMTFDSLITRGSISGGRPIHVIP